LIEKGNGAQADATKPALATVQDWVSLPKAIAYTGNLRHVKNKKTHTGDRAKKKQKIARLGSWRGKGEQSREQKQKKKWVGDGGACKKKKPTDNVRCGSPLDANAGEG